MILNYILKNNYIYKPPYNAEKQNFPKTRFGIPYDEFSINTKDVLDTDVDAVLLILFCHGNASDIKSSQNFVKSFCTLIARYLELLNIHIKCITWDYPTYGNCAIPESYLSKDRMFDLTEEMYLFMIDKYKFTQPTVRCVIGHSLGTAFASHIATLAEAPQICFLMNPFAKLVSGTGNSFIENYVTGCVFDNEEELLKKNKNCMILAYFAGRDEALPIIYNKIYLEKLCHKSLFISEAAHQDVMLDIITAKKVFHFLSVEIMLLMPIDIIVSAEEQDNETTTLN